MTDVDDRPTADLGSERRLSRLAGIVAGLSVVATIASVPVAATDIVKRTTSGDATDLDLLVSIGNSGSGQLAAMGLRVASAALLIPFAYVLWKMVRDRSIGRHSPWFMICGLAAFVVIGSATALAFFELRDTARSFIASGPQTVDRAEQVLADARGSGVLRAANIMQVVGGILFGLWISLNSMEAGRVGLLTRFLTFFGIGTGVASAIGGSIIQVGPALFLGWLGSVAILMLGFWPGGRPLSWDTGRAELLTAAPTEPYGRSRGGEEATR